MLVGPGYGQGDPPLSIKAGTWSTWTSRNSAGSPGAVDTAITGRAAGNRNKTGAAKNRRPGFAYLHNAVDDYSQFAYTEVLADEKKETAAAFWDGVPAAFNAAGITGS